MQPLKRLCITLALLFTTQASMAATINVTTALDEKNCNSAACGTNTNVHGKGCSLREAMANVANGNNTSYPECIAPTPAGPNTIDLKGLDVQVNGAVDDPNTVSGMPQVHNGSLEDDANVVDSASRGALTITNGSVSCFTDPTTHAGGRMFHVNTGGDLTLDKLTIHDCEDNELGIAVRTNSGTGSNNNSTSLTINNTTFTNIHSTDGSSGGAINHGDGNLTINDSAFTNCQIDDSNQTSGAHDASGGAIAIGAVGFNTTLAQIYNTAFTLNTAKTNGGAIQLLTTDSIVIVNGAFTSNKANGDTFASGFAELGGGAIYAQGTEMSNQLGSSFLIINSLFTLNSAPNGTGGAILVSGGNLTYGASLANPPGGISIGGGPPTTPPYPTNVPGGVFSTNFLSNSAGGKWNGIPVDNRAGAGGAIYASGNLAVLDSSFISNSSDNGSGGGIGQYGTSNSSSLSAGNSTFNGNSAKVNGGAIANLANVGNNFNPTMILNNDTLSGNSAGANGGGAIFNVGAPADVVVSNTILASSSAGGNCAPANGITDQTHNLQFGAGTDCGAGMAVGDPVLSGPVPFGGINFQVAVMKLNAGSAASGTGDPATCTGQPVYNLDAAFNGRPSGKPNCDVGAFESSIVPDLQIAKSHLGNFTRGDVGDTYAITVSNSGNDFTSGTVTVTDALPAGLTATGITGLNWNCVLATLTCTRSDALANGSNYDVITLTVNVAGNAPPLVINSVTVAGGSEADASNDSGSDPTVVLASDLTIAKSHSDPFTQADPADTYTITVTNSGAGATSNTVTVTDTLPAGLTATMITGTGWACTLGTLTCTRSDVLAGSGAVYPVIALTVSVAANAPVQVTNMATVAGGNESDTSNDTVNDLTNINPKTPVTLQSFEVD